jgi:RNA polymerase sigma-70 factor, ECF subfamily
VPSLQKDAPMHVSPVLDSIPAPAPAPRSGQWRLELVPLAGVVAANDGATSDQPHRPSRVVAAPAVEIRARLRETMPALQRRALYLARNGAEADDLVNDTVERALRFASGYESGTNLKAWLLQIMYTVFASRCRKSQRERTAHAALSHDPNAWSNPTSPGADSATVLDGFLTKLRALPRPYAEVLWLVDYHEYPYSDAAQTLGVPLGTVMSRLHRARRMMRAALDPQSSVG